MKGDNLEFNNAIETILKTTSFRCSGVKSKELINLLSIENIENKTIEITTGLINRPDIIIFSKDKIIAIEHFEYDDTLNKSNGSTGKALICKQEKEFEKKSINCDTYYCTYDNNNIIANYENYVKNITTSFNKHYKKVDDYLKEIKNLIKKKGLSEDIEVKLYFLLENTSSINPLMLVPNRPITVYTPFNSKEIKKLINESTNIDGVISVNYDDVNKCSKIIFYTKEDEVNVFDIEETIDERYYETGSRCHHSFGKLTIPKESIKND